MLKTRHEGKKGGNLIAAHKKKRRQAGTVTLMDFPCNQAHFIDYLDSLSDRFFIMRSNQSPGSFVVFCGDSRKCRPRRRMWLLGGFPDFTQCR